MRSGSVGSGLLVVFCVLVGTGAAGAQQSNKKKGQPPPQPAQPAVAMPRVVDTTLIPVLDRNRAVDAEVRSSLFDLMVDRPLRALVRLRNLDASGVDSTLGWRGAPERRFLIAECYYRLGMDDSLRTAAELTLAGPGGARFAPVLEPQLLLAAYRDGDYARVVELSRSLGPAEAGNGAASLFAGLAAYRLGQPAAARAAFDNARVAGAGGPFAAYAGYMSAIMDLKQDTTKIAAAAAGVDSMLAGAHGAAADQMRLTLAQLAYEGGQYDRADSEAKQVPTTGAVAAPALLTSAWAEYRAGHVVPAAQSFAQFAREYPELPARDESRLMYAQSALQLNHADSASTAFIAVADSVAGEAAAVGPNGSGLHGSGRLLVNARVADVLLLGDVAGGKAIAFPDSAGAGNDALRVTVTDSAAAAPPVPVPTPVSVKDLTHRLDAAGVDSAGVAAAGVAAGSALLRRAIFRPTSDALSRADLQHGIASLHDADVGVALVVEAGHYRDTTVALQLADLARMRTQIAAAGDSLQPEFVALTAQEDSLSNVSAAVDSSGTRLQRMFQVQVNGLRDLAHENQLSIDSVRQRLSGSRTSDDLEYLSREQESAATYQRMADEVQAGLMAAILRNPGFALRDTVRQRGERVRALIVQTRQAVSSGEAAVDTQVARINGGEAGERTIIQKQLAAAEARRDAAANALVIAVDREMTARATALIAELTKDREAADFGAGSALFFRAAVPDSTPPTSAGSTAPPPGAR
ncbi:MAG TPA: hypothetical protein VNW46_00725 [Gemmatimonadaceae bacterium]|nr:hypothetical protein [Gemmatimonadaceae bacterium]